MTWQPPQDPTPASVTPDPTDPDSLRPEVVDLTVVEKLGEAASAAPSEGSGVSGNVTEITVDPPPPPMAPPAGL